MKLLGVQMVSEQAEGTVRGAKLLLTPEGSVQISGGSEIWVRNLWQRGIELDEDFFRIAADLGKKYGVTLTKPPTNKYGRFVFTPEQGVGLLLALLVQGNAYSRAEPITARGRTASRGQPEKGRRSRRSGRTGITGVGQAMKMPELVARFWTQEQWDKLKLHELEPEDRELVLDALNAGLEGADPETIDKEDLKAVIGLTQSLADMLATPFDGAGYTERSVRAAKKLLGETAKRKIGHKRSAIRSGGRSKAKANPRQQEPSIRYHQVLVVIGSTPKDNFCSVEFYHDWIPDQAVAGIVGYDYCHAPEKPVLVRILKLHPSFPIRVVKRNLTPEEENMHPIERISQEGRVPKPDGGRALFGSESESCSAPGRSADWTTIVADTKSAVQGFLKGWTDGQGLIHRDVTWGRVTERVRFVTNC